MIQKGFSGFKRFLAVMETEPEIQDSPDAKPLKDVRGLVSFEDVSFHYSDDDTLVLSNVSFRFRQENPLPLPVRQEAEKLQSAPFCRDFMM